MGAILLKNTCLLFLLISTPFLSTSFAGRRSNFLSLKQEGGGTATPKIKWEANEQFEESFDNNGGKHERILRANTHDYGRYDPAPTFVKPPFKLIPN